MSDVRLIGIFTVIDFKVIADSDNKVDTITRLFPVDTIISTQHNNTQNLNDYFDYDVKLNNNTYRKNYYIIEEKNGDKIPVERDVLTPIELTNSRNAIEKLPSTKFPPVSKSKHESKHESKSKRVSTKSIIPYMKYKTPIRTPKGPPHKKTTGKGGRRTKRRHQKRKT